MIEILEIEPGSIAQELKIQPGARLIHINGKEINDNLDYRFHCSGEELEVCIEQNGEKIIYEIEKDIHEDLGLILEDLKMRKCGNKCIFCFVHQSPKGLRKALYFKDEDYRFSFLYGHYVTLTNVTQADLDRIVEQRLSPLYVSVHVTDPDRRKYMLGIKHDDFLLEKLRYLTQRGIELHCQIVLCPGLNDGEYLERTLADLLHFYPGVRSVAIVPVGLTRHRKNLPALQPVTPEYSLRFMEEMDRKRAQIKSLRGSSFVYLSDEFFIRTQTPIPDDSYYEGFYQLENGVGLTRDFINHFRRELPKLKVSRTPLHLSLVTGILGARVLEQYILPALRRISSLKITLHEVVNHFYGESIVVSGLLVGQDIYHQISGAELGDYVILPPRVLNHDGLFLDDWTLDDLENKLGKAVMVFPESFRKLFQRIAEMERETNPKNARRIRHQIPQSYLVEHMKGEK
ncbi:MAG: DUF512 domain-containing protein [Calditrichia bacterium]